LFIATGINEEGERVMLDFKVCSAENDVNWLSFFENLKDRGLSGVKLIVSDAHKSIRKAALSVFPCLWQRCMAHFKRNLVANISHKDKKKVHAYLDLVLESNSYEKAKEELSYVTTILNRDYSEAGKVLENAGLEIITYYNFPEEHRRKIYTTNFLERFNREIKRRTKAVSIFPNSDSLERLAGAIIIKQDTEWNGVNYLPKNSMELLRDAKEEARIMLDKERRDTNIGKNL
jgi:transposase-like protein